VRQMLRTQTVWRRQHPDATNTIDHLRRRIAAVTLLVNGPPKRAPGPGPD
jgi:hypothetical protein